MSNERYKAEFRKHAATLAEPINKLVGQVITKGLIGIIEQCVEMQDRIKELEAALAKAQAQAAVADNWRPIETAPTDGRKILVGYPNIRGRWRTVTAVYHKFDDGWEIDDDTDDAEGWYESNENQETLFRTEEKPTKWQPLPAAPTPDSEKPL